MKKTFRPDELSTITGAARAVERTPEAVRKAIDRGRIDAVNLGCGQRVVVMDSVVKWDKSDSTPGRKPNVPRVRSSDFT